VTHAAVPLGGRKARSVEAKPEERPGKEYVRTVVVGMLVPSKGLLLVRRALDESIESVAES
jgi:hypothetical protein